MKMLIILAASLVLLGGFYVVSNYVSIVEVQEEQTIQVDSLFGCVTLNDEYTEDQWEAKQDFTEKFFRYKLRSCN